MQGSDTESSLNSALRNFEATEANLEKLERLFDEILALIPDGIEFGNNAEYDRKCRAFRDVLASLPTINSWKPDARLMELNEIAQTRLDGHEIGEIQVEISLQEAIDAPGRQLADYRDRLQGKRRDLVRTAIKEHVATIDDCLSLPSPLNIDVQEFDLEKVSSCADEIDTLLGNAFEKHRDGSTCAVTFALVSRRTCATSFARTGLQSDRGFLMSFMAWTNPFR